MSDEPASVVDGGRNGKDMCAGLPASSTMLPPLAPADIVVPEVARSAVRSPARTAYVKLRRGELLPAEYSAAAPGLPASSAMVGLAPPARTTISSNAAVMLMTAPSRYAPSSSGE